MRAAKIIIQARMLSSDAVGKAYLMAFHELRLPILSYGVAVKLSILSDTYLWQVEGVQSEERLQLLGLPHYLKTLNYHYLLEVDNKF